ncbi:hypothetical protein H9W91_07230 [Streptomyces alfalfae]|uniref:hypothetical protein n=1 Tax=Streptomyces alfalfae TaxID=1642299 RepID=UPI001BA9CD98|nr:hypothetical protein [Streptomyces alfalfae]QUI30673.1 hypothetical protein H9W91_07230 [Streptomyces alfalfae]
MSADCYGHCDDCPYTWCVPEVRTQPTKAAVKRSWRQDAQDELDELADLYGIDPGMVRL